MDILSGFSLRISDNEYRLFSDLIYERSGICLGSNKKELIRARLMKRMRFFRFRSYRDYYDYVVNDKSGQELTEMLDVVSTNVTSFFREKQHFDYMSNNALPDIFEQKKKLHQKRLRIWSAGCSTGEEAYSILITIAEYMRLREDWDLWDIKILGTDISTRVLRVAREGKYDYMRLKGVPCNILNDYFIRKNEGGGVIFKVKDFLRRDAYFHRVNLMGHAFPFHGAFDIIFCRNTMIYFDRETQVKLVHKLSSYLDNYGYLFIGHSETLIGMQTNLKSQASAVFRKA